MIAPWHNGDPRAVVQRVLADPRYRSAPRRPGEKPWTEYVWEWLRNLWHQIAAPLHQLTGNSRLATIVGVAALIAVILLLLFAAAAFAAKLSWRRSPGRPRTASFALGPGDDAQTLLARALDAAGAGRQREAAALLWASALHALDERGRVRYDAARTPGEWRRAVHDPAFDALARDAVVALFGDAETDAALVARMRDAYDRVVSPA